MSGLDWAGLLLMAGVGGVVGAASAVLVAGARTQAAYALFKGRFLDYFGARDDAASAALMADFLEVDGSLSGLMGSVDKLKRALKLK